MIRLAAMVVVLGLAVPAGAQGPAGPRHLVLALYAPTAPLGSAEARFAYVDRLAQHLSTAGAPVKGRAFIRSADLEAAIRRGQVDVAVLDAVYLAERGTGYPVLATATIQGEASLRWGLYTSAAQDNVLGLSGSRLAWAGVGREPTFLDNVLLNGELQVARFFDLRPPAPDIASAVSEVVLRRAECVFAPEPAVVGKGLRRVYDAGKVPNPALVQVQGKLPRDMVARLQRAAQSASDLPVFDGFQRASAETYKGLRQRLVRPRASRRLVMAEPPILYLELRGEQIIKDDPSPAMPPLRGLLSLPTQIP